jgi:hypothetical protein
MKYICLGYMDESKWETMTEEERNSFMDEAFAYDEELKKKGHFIGGEALQPATNATTLRYRNGKVTMTDGPFIETPARLRPGGKEQIGGIIILEARDLNHAIQLMSKHPSLRMGSSWEIRPAADLTALIMESERRRMEANR